MSEEVSTKQIAKEQSTDPNPIQPWSAESEASRFVRRLEQTQLRIQAPKKRRIEQILSQILPQAFRRSKTSLR